MLKLHQFFNFLIQPVPTFSFDGTTVIGGKCEGRNKHSVILQWAIDNATVQIDFVNDTGSVSMLLTFAFVPFKVWGSGSKGEWMNRHICIFFYFKGAVDHGDVTV